MSAATVPDVPRPPSAHRRPSAPVVDRPRRAARPRGRVVRRARRRRHQPAHPRGRHRHEPSDAELPLRFSRGPARRRRRGGRAGRARRTARAGRHPRRPVRGGRGVLDPGGRPAEVFAPLFFELSTHAMRGQPHAHGLRTWLRTGWLDALSEATSTSGCRRSGPARWPCSRSRWRAACSSRWPSPATGPPPTSPWRAGPRWCAREVAPDRRRGRSSGGNTRRVRRLHPCVLPPLDGPERQKVSPVSRS